MNWQNRRAGDICTQFILPAAGTAGLEEMVQLDIHRKLSRSARLTRSRVGISSIPEDSTFLFLKGDAHNPSTLRGASAVLMFQATTNEWADVGRKRIG
jgi:hypothetical protein